ncbi:formyltetrahydrofolate deformylase [Streptomyces sp. NPDC020883]|uniref:formyltetrahydrofolate deformylase n=1 Tax=Streptomyces sp. NPDC020883 TaxID=3365099 RepID=UPI0037A0DC2E
MSANPVPVRNASPEPHEVPQRNFVITLRALQDDSLLAVLRHLLDCEYILTEHQHHTEGGRTFARVQFATQQPIRVDELRDSFTAVSQLTSAGWQLHVAGQKIRTLVVVSKFGHCLNDLLFRSRIGALPVEIAAVASNHTDFAELVGSYDIPFHHIPVTRDTKPAAEARLLELVRKEGVELVVLARYMQILSSELCNLLPGKIINIHHAILPSFKGARPYHQAHARGVKLIGATAHYVTADLDEGPIIAQQAEAIDHRMAPERLVALGQDIEARTLTRAVQWHSEHRVMLHDRRTIVFS